MPIQGLGNIGGSVVSAVIGTLGLIIFLTIMPTALGSINNAALGNKTACVLPGGERYDRLSAVRSGTDSADVTWGKTTAFTAVTITAGSACVLASDGVAANTHFTPNGTLVTVGTDKTALTPTATGTARISIYNQYSGLIDLMWLAVGLVPPLAILGLMGGAGALLVARVAGGSPLIIGIVTTIALLVMGTLIPLIAGPLGIVQASLGAQRFYLYDHGIGTLAAVAGGFYGLIFVGGLLTVIGFVIFRFASSVVAVRRGSGF